MLAEVAGSFLTGSLALLSDVAHMFTDAAAFTVLLIDIRVARPPSTAGVIWRWTWFDPVLCVGIVLWVLPRTWTLLRKAGNVLLEGVPAGVTSMRSSGRCY